MLPNPLPSVDELNRLFKYDPVTGNLIWRTRPERSYHWNARFVGTIAGHCDGRAVTVTINNQPYFAHRIIFKMLHGVEPPAVVDHINRRGDNNTANNLRAADKSLNGANSKDRKRRRQLPRGVHPAQSRPNPYRVVIGNKHIGVFPTIESAYAAYKQNAQELYGEFANIKQEEPA
jgi:HNH endonuclease